MSLGSEKKEKIKAVALDLGGVLIREVDYPLSKTAQILERQFGNINSNEEYYNWAMKTTKLPREKLEEITRNIIENIYVLRDSGIFDGLPNVKLAIASNHLSAIHYWIDKAGIKKYFDYILISADIGAGKPEKEFFEKLVYGLQEKPEAILLVDDSLKNIEGAKKFGLSTLHFNNFMNLRDEIRKYFV